MKYKTHNKKVGEAIPGGVAQWHRIRFRNRRSLVRIPPGLRDFMTFTLQCCYFVNTKREELTFIPAK
jgi:hypothetical protein